MIQRFKIVTTTHIEPVRWTGVMFLNDLSLALLDNNFLLCIGQQIDRQRYIYKKLISADRYDIQFTFLTKKNIKSSHLRSCKQRMVHIFPFKKKKDSNDQSVIKIVVGKFSLHRLNKAGLDSLITETSLPCLDV